MMRIVVLLVLMIIAPLRAEAAHWFVSRVLTGETFASRQGIYRLRGINAPQIEEARKHLKSLILNHEIAILQPHQLDGSNRLWVYVQDEDGQDAGAAMIRDGFAMADLCYPHELSEEYLQLEIQARREGRGLWADSVETSLSYEIFSGDSLHKPLLRPLSRDSLNITSDTSFTVYVNNVLYHLPGCWYVESWADDVSLIRLVRRGQAWPCGMCSPPVLDTTNLVTEENR